MRIALLLLLLASPTLARGVHVRGHLTKTGTYVAPHVRSAPNRSKLDNWSTKGQVNPRTGKAGTK